MDRFEELYTYDETLCKNIESLTLEVLFVWNKLEKQQPAAQRNTRVAGSIVEGGGMARIFQKNTFFPDELNREAEADIEIIMVEIPYYMKHIVRDIQGKPGYVNVRAGQELLEHAKEIGWKITDTTRQEINNATSSHGWLKPYKIKEAALNRMPVTQKTAKKLEPVVADVLNKKTEDVSITTTQVITKSSIQSDIMISINAVPFFKLSYDMVTLLKLTWWPAIAQQWKSRDRNWPSPTEIEKISRLCYIINKPSPTEKDNEETVELRYSFTHVERDLVCMRSRHQNKVYLIFKIMFLKWIKPLDPEHISSFVAKTIMFWACEEFPPDHEMWNEDLDSMLISLSYLFLQTKEAFEKHNLPYFFIHTVNVIENMPEDIASIVAMKIEKLLKNLVDYLPFPMDKELAGLKELVHAVKSTIKVFDELKANDFAIFFRRPELMQNASFLELILAVANQFVKASVNPETALTTFLDCFNAFVTKIPKEDHEASGAAQGGKAEELGQGLLNAFMEAGQSDENVRHKSEKNKGEEEYDQGRVENIVKNIFGNVSKLFEAYHLRSLSF